MMYKYKYQYPIDNLKPCACGHCDELIPIRDKWGRYGKYKRGHGTFGKKYPNAPKGSQCWQWKGGRKLRKDGYFEVMVKNHPRKDRNGYVLEHRLIMEKHLGRYLTSKEVVHHKDNNRQNNDIENLELLCGQSEHVTIHNNQRYHFNNPFFRSDA